MQPLRSLLAALTGRSREALAERIAHDIRSPLAALLTVERALESEGSPQLPLLRSAIDRLRSLADQLAGDSGAERQPQGVAQGLSIPAGAPVIAIDDDPSVHQIWSRRISSGFTGFLDEASFSRWIESHAETAARAIFLVDFELKGSPRNGIELIRKHGIQKNAYLVTSRYDEPEVQAACLREKVRLIPKSQAGLIPIETAVSRENAEHFDFALIDDDPLVRLMWKTAAEKKGVRLALFASPAEFHAAIHSPAQVGTVYIDSELGQGLKGEDEARRLSERGFARICLATGHDPSRFARLTFLAAVVGKEPPF